MYEAAGVGLGAGADRVVSEAYRTPAGPLRAIAEELLRHGVRDVVICPGSRSTPLALALRAAPGLRCWVHLDERAGAFFALGAAKADRRPVAILATSGTAVVNFAPAVVEARYGRVPLLLLTADRPPELHDVAAPQTIDQVGLYGRHAKWYAEIQVPDASVASESLARESVARAVATAVAPPAGPVQLNMPFREPLIPDGPLGSTVSVAAAETVADDSVEAGVTIPELEAIADLVARARRGLIVCGPLDVPHFPEAVARLAAVTGFPVLADGLSNVRTGPHDRTHVVAHYDALLRTPAFRGAPAPDLVLRFGARPTSKVLDQLLDGLDAPQVLVADGGWSVPRGPMISRLEAEPRGAADALAEACRSQEGAAGDWLATWQAAETVAEDAVETWARSLDEPFEGALFTELDEVLPDGAIVMVGNSMPVRDLDAFLRRSGRSIRCLGNRGANGIDGLVSTALGAAAVGAQPVVAVVGDVSFLHDLNALVAARRLDLSATIVLINNDGGGIFSFLPQAVAERPGAGLPEHFEELFGTPHGTDFGPLVTALGAEHVLADHDSLGSAVSGSAGRPGVRVVELRTERARNVELHRAAQAAVARALEGLAWA